MLFRLLLLQWILLLAVLSLLVWAAGRRLEPELSRRSYRLFRLRQFHLLQEPASFPSSGQAAV